MPRAASFARVLLIRTRISFLRVTGLNEFELKIKGADYLEILAAGGGIISTVEDTRDASLERPGRAQALRGSIKCSPAERRPPRSKPVTASTPDTEMKMLAAIDELDQTHPIDHRSDISCRPRGSAGYKGNSEEYVDLICDTMLPKAWKWYRRIDFHRRKTPFFAMCFAKRMRLRRQTRRILETAKSLGFGLKAHVDQFTNLGGSRLAIDMGAVSIDHLDAISDDEIKLLAASETVGVVTPTENFNFGKYAFCRCTKADRRRLCCRSLDRL